MIIKNGRNIQNGLCIIESFSNSQFIGLTNINFCDKENTIKEYKGWEMEALMTVIPLNRPKSSPQMFRKSEINRVENIYNLKEVAFENGDFDLEKEDVFVPFLGDPDNIDYSELINCLWEIDSDNIWDYRKTVINYYRDKFNEIEKNKSKEE